MIKRIFVDKGNCTSCGLCAETHPQYFRLNNYDLAESHNMGGNVNNAVVDDEHLKIVQVAIDDCPGECIHWQTEGLADIPPVAVAAGRA